MEKSDPTPEKERLRYFVLLFELKFPSARPGLTEDRIVLEKLVLAVDESAAGFIGKRWEAAQAKRSDWGAVKFLAVKKATQQANANLDHLRKLAVEAEKDVKSAGA